MYMYILYHLSHDTLVFLSTIDRYFSRLLSIKMRSKFFKCHVSSNLIVWIGGAHIQSQVHPHTVNLPAFNRVHD